jgi:hypothetical protein
MYLGNHFIGECRWFADHQATDGVARKVKVDYALCAFAAQVLVRGTLDYAE